MKNEPLKNPYEENGEWFFYDETYESSGPYKTEEEAKYQLNRYCRIQLGPPYYSKGQWQFYKENMIVVKLFLEGMYNKLQKSPLKLTIDKPYECFQFVGETNTIKETFTVDFDNNQALLTYENKMTGKEFKEMISKVPDNVEVTFTDSDRCVISDPEFVLITEIREDLSSDNILKTTVLEIMIR